MKESKNKLLKIAVSIGDINGISMQILLQSHEKINKICKPFYFIHESLLYEACKLLKAKKIEAFHIVAFSNSPRFEFEKNKHIKIGASEFFKKLYISHFKMPLDFEFQSEFAIKSGEIDAKSGAYSFASFKAASFFVKEGFANALVTLPIHKKAWQEAGIKFKGHTGALSEFFKSKALMMLGCSKLFVGLFTEHIPLREVGKHINESELCEFLELFYQNTHFKDIGVLGFNPHAGDFGSIGGQEEKNISKAIALINSYLSFTKLKSNLQKEFSKTNSQEILLQKLINDTNLHEKLEKFLHKQKAYKFFYKPYPLVADSAFTKNSLQNCKRLVAMYHDQALAPLKALYFDESVNISLNLPIIRTSVDHGTGFDKAYKKEKILTKSYKEAIKMAIKFAKNANKV